MVTSPDDYVSSLLGAIQKPGFFWSKLPGLCAVEAQLDIYGKTVVLNFHFDGDQYLSLTIPYFNALMANLHGDIQKYVAFRLAEYRVEVRHLLRKIPARHLLIGGPKHGESTVINPEHLHQPLIMTVGVPPMIPPFGATPVAFAPELVLEQVYYPHVMVLNKHYFIPFFHESVPTTIRNTLFDETIKEKDGFWDSFMFSGAFEVCV